MKTTYSSNIPQPDATRIAIRRNLESGSKVAAEFSGVPRSRRLASWSGRWSNLGADHIKRWEKRLYLAKSGGVEVGKLAVRIQHKGHRDEFRFDTTNRAAAAVQALEVFRYLKANGWEATLAKYKPEGEIKLQTTVGDYLTAASKQKLRPRTFLNYQNALRTVAAEIFGVKEDKGVSKFDYRRKGEPSGRDRWLAKIDNHRLEELTVDKINAWKRQRIARAGTSPVAQASTRRTVNSYLRCARSLFTPAISSEVRKSLTLPDALPFAGVELEANGSTKYVSKINAQALIAAAREELKAADPEAYKAFLLGLFAGLRKAEIDLLEWPMLDFAANLIRLEETDWLHLKTADSAAEITVEPEVLAELRALQPKAGTPPAQWSQFVLASNRPPKPESLRPYYRCEETFDRLNTWLRGKGITANKPLHELRKELGAIIATEHGIYAASTFLRHSDITTTARHYATHKTRINVGLGKYLGMKPKTAPAAGKS